jgi:hypothetical protein
MIRGWDWTDPGKSILKLNWPSRGFGHQYSRAMSTDSHSEGEY